MEDAYRTALACLPGINPMGLPRLLGMVGDPVELWNLLARGGRRAVALVGEEKAGQWMDACRGTSPMEMLEDLRRRGIRVIIPGHASYPQRLCEIYDPPPLLFARGGEPPEETAYVAVVGARKASNYGKWAAEVIGGELARRGVVVVSGAAYGVDGHAHLGCLKAGGFTIAVLGCGVDRAYPPGHAQLLGRIADSGCVLSEYQPGSDPLPWHFPHRNRVIAGLSHAVVVVEASARSGALITADLALEEGREVMALPGPITSTLSSGTNTLIQRGAKLVSCVDDILEELPFPLRGAGQAEGTPAGNAEKPEPVELEILELLQGGSRGLDWLAACIKEPPGELLSRLANMTLRGLVIEEAGGRYALLASPKMRPRSKK